MQRRDPVDVWLTVAGLLALCGLLAYTFNHVASRVNRVRAGLARTEKIGGSLTVDGPLVVRGNLYIGGPATVHGPQYTHDH